MKTKNILCLILVPMFSMSCAGFLEQDLKSQLDADKAFNSANNAILAVNGVYSTLATKDGWGLYDANLSVSDAGTYAVAAFAGNSTRITDFQNYSLTPYNDTVSKLYGLAYASIQEANFTIEQLEKLSNIDDRLKNRLIAECKFVRSLMYFNLVRQFGGVPLKLTSTKNMDNMFMKRDGIEKIYDAIIADLEFCVDHLWYKSSSVLEPRYEASDNGRATKCAALGMLSKVYLTAASYKKHSTLHEAWNSLSEINNYQWVDMLDYYSKAANTAKQLISLSESGQVDVKLNDDYGLLFTPKGENSSESLFEVQFSDDVTTSGRFGGWTTMNGLPNSSKRVIASAELFLAYDKHYTEATGIDMENTDPRLLWNVATSYYKNGKLFPCTSINNLSFFKYRTNGFQKLVDCSEINFPVLRYADVLLMYAEAMNELGHVGEAVNYVNQIRARARRGIKVGMELPVPFKMAYSPSNVPADLRLAEYDQARLREAIMKERILELAGEGQGRFDEVRMGVLVSNAQTYKDYEDISLDVSQDFYISIAKNPNFPEPKVSTLSPNGETLGALNVKDFHQLLPIPKSEMDKNPTDILYQNPGW